MSTAQRFIDAWTHVAVEVFETHKAKGWTDREINDGEQIALMHGELSEALEGMRKDLMDDHLPHRKMAEVELADVVIRMMNYATLRGYDVATALIEKAEYNKNRPHKHGGKKF